MLYRLKLLVHACVGYVAVLAAYGIPRGPHLGWWLHDPQAKSVFLLAAAYFVISLVVELFTRTELGSWRFSSARDAIKLGRNTALACVVLLIIVFLTTRAATLSRSAILLIWAGHLFGLLAIRIVWRAIHDRSLVRDLAFWRPKKQTGVPLIIVGKTAEAGAYLRHIQTVETQDYHPIMIISSDSTRQSLVHGCPVFSDVSRLKDHLRGVVPAEGEKAAVLFLEDPVTDLELTSDQVAWVRSKGFLLLRKPRLSELGANTELREIKLEELLQRTPIKLDSAPVSAMVKGKRVMVTGAGGSIGSEIARQLVSLDCAHITLLDHSEFLLFEIDRELMESGPKQLSKRAVLCNVRDEDRVNEVFEAEKPDLVFHAAALKHVTLVENNPNEGVMTNVVGTWNIAKAACQSGASQTVLISTDKAVSPTNVMGATKRIAEAALAAHAQAATRCCAVRFGNVLGSAGSVVPILKDQIARGGPVTITHPDVERYFMTIPEAVQLVLHAAAVSAGSEDAGMRKFVLEMGQPVKILALAKQLIALSQRTPGVEIPIEIIGLRPGEKMTEVLLDPNETSVACLPGINEIVSISGEIPFVRDDLERLRSETRKGRRESLVGAIYDTLHRREQSFRTPAQ